MASKFTYLRVGLATSLSLALGGPTVASVFAEPAQPVMPSQVLFQDDDDDDDGGTVVSGVWDPTPRPVAIHRGTIQSLGDDVAELNSLAAPDGQPVGSDDGARAEYGYTPQIPLSLDELTDDDHVIIVELSDLNDTIIAYGHIGGVRDGNGSLVVNLVSGDDDDDDGGNIYGIAVLTPNASNPGTTDASIFIAGSSLGDDIGSSVDDDDRDHDNDGRDDDDADGDGVRDHDDDDDDDGIRDDDDDDDDNDGRFDDDDDDDRGGDDFDDGPGGDDDFVDDNGFDDDGPGGDDDDGFDDDGPGGDDDGPGGDDDGDDTGDDNGSDDDFDDDGGDDDGDDDFDDDGGDDDGDDDDDDGDDD